MNSSPPPRSSSRRRTRRASHSSCGSTPRTCTSGPTSSRKAAASPAAGSPSTTTCMIDHDKLIGEMLKLLDELDIADNTMVMYSTDNGPHMNSWPDAGTTPFRCEKNSSWEGAYRVPCMVRCPGRIKPGRCPTKSSATRTGCRPSWRSAGGPTSSRQAEEGPQGHRQEDLQGPPRRLQPVALPHGQGEEARAKVSSTSPTMATWRPCATTTGRCVHGAACRGHAADLGRTVCHRCACPRSSTCAPTPTSVRGHTSNTYYDWMFDHVFLLVPAQAGRREFLETFKEFPPRQKSASFSLDQVVEQMLHAAGGGGR